MSVYLYKGGERLIKKSGVGQAILHQQKVLQEAEMDPVLIPDADTSAVHINTVFPDSLLTADLAKLRGHKVVYYAHSTMEDFRRSFRGSDLLAPLFKRWIVRCYSHGDVILTPTEYSKHLLQSYGIKKPIYSISNGVDTSFFRPDKERGKSFRKRYGLSDDERVVISVGHMIERKGIIDYIELAKSMPDTRFFWFGYTAPEIIPAKIRDAVANAPGNVVFPGFVDQNELRDAYCGADVFAFLSKEETEGIVVLEALACGIPTVLRDIPVYDGWLDDGRNVYKGNDISEFHKLVSGVLDKTLPDLTDAGRATALQRSYRAVGERLKDIYIKEGLVSKKHKYMQREMCNV